MIISSRVIRQTGEAALTLINQSVPVSLHSFIPPRRVNINKDKEVPLILKHSRITPQIFTLLSEGEDVSQR